MGSVGRAGDDTNFSKVCRFSVLRAGCEQTMNVLVRDPLWGLKFRYLHKHAQCLIPNGQGNGANTALRVSKIEYLEKLFLVKLVNLYVLEFSLYCNFTLSNVVAELHY